MKRCSPSAKMMFSKVSSPEALPLLSPSLAEAPPLLLGIFVSIFHVPVLSPRSQRVEVFKR